MDDSASAAGPLSTAAGGTFLLPAGMRDLLPEEARSRRTLARVVLDHMELHGYALVTLPAFEIADVLERGLGTLDPRDVLRFIEPETGEVLALRPDVTPQIARMVATRLRDRPPPLRLAYEGTIVRRRQERARRHRQIPQTGLELLGVAGPAGDREILLLAASCVRAVGIPRFVLDVGHAEIVRSLLAVYPKEHAARLREALELKDSGLVATLSRLPSVSARVSEATAALPSLRGDVTVLDRAEAVFSGTPASSPLSALRAVIDDDVRRALGDVLSFDLGEVRGFAYYTGVLFHAYAEGPGEALGGGGRYDELLGRFDAPMPAAGFALDLDHLAWARRAAGATDRRAIRLAIAPGPRALGIAYALRQRGLTAAIAGEGDLHAYARAWGFTMLLEPRGDGFVVAHLDGTGHSAEPVPGSDADVAAWAEAFLRDAGAGFCEVEQPGEASPAGTSPEPGANSCPRS